MSYLTAPQYLCINAWLYHMHVHGISKKEKKRNPNLPCEGKTKNEDGRRRLIGMKTGQNRSILCKQNKEIEAKRVGLGFLGTSMHMHT